jgi:hypothetical protein
MERGKPPARQRPTYPRSRYVLPKHFAGNQKRHGRHRKCHYQNLRKQESLALIFHE